MPPSGSPATRWVDPLALARSLPGLACVGGPALTATMGNAHRFATASTFRAFTGLAPRVGDRQHRPQGPTHQQGRQPAAADHPSPRRRHRPPPRPQLARFYQVQMVQRGNGHLGAVCVVAAHLAERAWAVMDRGMPYVICDTDNTPVSPEQAKRIIAQQWTVPEEVRRRRRSRKAKGRPLTKSSQDLSPALKAQRGGPPHRPVLAGRTPTSSQPTSPLDNPNLHRESENPAGALSIDDGGQG